MTDTAGRNPPEMPPGRELDAELAEKVMGWTHVEVLGVVHPTAIGRTPANFGAPVPHYSTEWDAMRLVVERLVALGCLVAMDVSPKGGAWCAIITNPDTEFDSDDRDVFNEKADTLPHAVALAALKAVTSAQQSAEASRE